jgi:hypothetical protein
MVLKGLWRWCMLYRTIWLGLDSVHRLVSGSFTNDHNVSETGSVSENLWSFVKLPHTRRWTEFKRSQIVLYLWSCFCGALSLTRGSVCLLYMLLTLASAVFLGSESLRTRDHILLSQIWDFPFRRLLRLAGSWWRYSTPPPHELEFSLSLWEEIIAWTTYKTIPPPILLLLRVHSLPR